MLSRAELDAEVLRWIAEGPFGAADDARFDALARAVFAHQWTHCEAYRRICESQGVREPQVADWREIPLVPTGAFKEARLAAFPAEKTLRTFRTSGTTTEKRGEHHLDTLALYEASLLQTFPSFVCPDLEPGQRLPFFVLAPSPEAAPDSSLSYMFGAAVRELGSADSRFWLRPVAMNAGAARASASRWTLDADACIDALARVREPVAVVGTAFAFVHLLDRITELGHGPSLPAGSRVMETGGFKGQSRELTRSELHGAISTRIGVPLARIVNQYGMCELGSQFYEPSLREGRVVEWKHVPPWVRTRALSPETLKEVPEGELGMLAHYDLANTGSVLAVLTSDLGRVEDHRIELAGRLAGAEARGCSRAADALLGGA